MLYAVHSSRGEGTPKQQDLLPESKTKNIITKPDAYGSGCSDDFNSKSRLRGLNSPQCLESYWGWKTTGGVRNRQDISAPMRPAFFDDVRDVRETQTDHCAGRQREGGNED